MQFSPVAIEYRRLGILRWRLLVDHQLARPFSDIEPVVCQVDAERPQAFYNVVPTSKDAAGVASEGDDVAQDFELRE